ncbi:hypothetical protein CgunFtcFv8_009362 [Champsocephalus gunnari]|uniref:Uncharacterized protein n=1 Tax=Champsocephalus gunnari TaxID=52237 RepID=A0AAN8C2R1_CHAGU|nr:hypothetical protein CgunFtcFv8_009362 [Champsocephalus gunnari]
MKLSLGTFPARPPASSPPIIRAADGVLFSLLFCPYQCFFLGFKGYLQPFCLGPLARVAESGQPTTGVSAADKHEGRRGNGRQWVRGGAEGGREIWRSIEAWD